MKISRLVPALAGLTMATAAVAEDPNIEPGMWETTSTVTIQSDQFPIPPQTNTTSNCVSADDIQEGQAFMEDNEECQFTDKDIRADGMTYTMTCATPDGGAVTMNAEMSFDGDTMSGVVDGDMETPMGVMKMHVEMDGRRTGDC
ncbi:MAG: DUF3617 family protein [Wenzhouxiangellaceae bacterium]|nr:DUF3617 family protein [Wenzhouxiangellaceae bacterium]